MNSETFPFKLHPLKYPYDALEDVIDKKTVEIHHDKHLKSYVDKLNKALENCPQFQSWTLEKLLKNGFMLPNFLQCEIIKNGGGVSNHNLYFDILKPPCECNMPVGTLAKSIDRCFGSFYEFKKNMQKTAENQFGSGYAFLASDKMGGLKIIPSINQNSPISLNMYPIIPLDVWEHAYYLKYQNRRSEYVEKFFSIIDWERCEEIYKEIIRI